MIETMSYNVCKVNVKGFRLETVKDAHPLAVCYGCDGQERYLITTRQNKSKPLGFVPQTEKLAAGS